MLRLNLIAQKQKMVLTPVLFCAILFKVFEIRKESRVSTLTLARDSDPAFIFGRYGEEIFCVDPVRRMPWNESLQWIV